jgi:hypothetical protein
MGVEDTRNSIALKTIAHRVGSYKYKISKWPTQTWGIQTASSRINSPSYD